MNAFTPIITPVDGASEMTRYERACRALAEAKAVDEVKDVRDQAMAMRLYAKQAKNRQLEGDAYEIRLRAERRVGEMMAAQPKAKPPGGSDARPLKDRVSEKPDQTITLSDAGIDKNLANRARKLHAMPANEFERVVNEGREAIERGVERNALKRVEIAEARAAYEARADNGGRVDDLLALASSGKRFAAILVDPPWKFHTYSGKGKQRSADRHYDTMSIDDIKALPVEALAADDCALFLWAVCPEIPGALEVITAWGFTYKTFGFVWTKTNPSGQGLHTGMGYWTRANVEPCLLATRGNPQRLAMDVHQVITPVGEHSAKPEEVHTRIERLLAGPYLELFARAERLGWTTWGNEIAREAPR